MNKFQTAQDTIIEASAAAAQTAKQNMQDVYTKATKIALNIDLKAPDVVIPVDSKSYEAILLDMGHISLTNAFLVLDIKNDLDHKAVIDEMKMKLTNFKLIRIELDRNTHESINECVLLEPVTFNVAVRRNLSASWYKAVSDLDISGQMKSIKVRYFYILMFYLSFFGYIFILCKKMFT